MTRRCSSCQRINPSEAAFCYFDGKPLGETASRGNTSIDFGSWSFPRPFVFPNGAQCHTFKQLALSCVRHPKETIDALRGGFFGTFFGSLGRIDLAVAAKALAAMPDADRALDELLGKLPGSPLRPAQLVVEPAVKNVGMVQMGEDHQFTLKLSNKGDRLVHGKAIVVDCPWLALGESGTPEKLFQFFESTTLLVRIPGRRLHAFAKTQKGEITIESSGGNVVVPVEVQVPIKPFPEAVLAGATSPRQLAMLAKAHIKEAATLIENGAVKRWYEANGWTYPVQGPTALGIAAVQQLFEYLGLVKPPKVELSESSVSLRGAPGERSEHTLTVTTQEKRAVFAHAVGDQPWLKIGKTVFRGQSATIMLLVKEVPAKPGQTLKARAKVIANGNQRFDVEVSLYVSDGSAAPRSVREESEFPFFAPAQQEEDPEVSPFANLTGPAPRKERSRQVAAVSAFADLTAPAETAPAPLPEADAPAPHVPPPPPPPPPPLESRPGPAKAATPAKTSGRARRIVMRLLPLVIAVAGFVSAVAHDMITVREPVEVPLPDVDRANPVLALRFHEATVPGDFVKAPSMRFGLGIADPNKPGTFTSRLIYDDMGRTCNVCVRIDKNVEFLLGVEQGAWKKPLRGSLGKDAEGNPLIGARSVWQRSGPPKIVITQTVEIVPEGLSADGSTRLLDTCLVRYDITNEDTAPHTVGLRFLLDTFIGSTDAVPFAIAGVKELCESMKSFDKPEDVPDFIQAMEKQDVTDPGTVAQLNLRYAEFLEPPGRMTLGAWPAERLRREPSGAAANMHNTRWEVPLMPMAMAKSPQNPEGDWAVTLYWPPKELRPRQTRTVGFAYGLGSVTADKEEGRLGITAGGEMVEDRDFTVIAYLKEPTPKTTVTLTLPPGLTLTSGDGRQSAAPVPAGSASPYSPVSWRIRASKSGVYRVKLSVSGGPAAEHRIAIKPAGSTK
jgi:hypothetical protein